MDNADMSSSPPIHRPECTLRDPGAVRCATRRRLLRGAVGSAAALAVPWAVAAARPVRIALIRSMGGIFEAYGRQTTTGFQMGLEYATGGTLAVEGRSLEVIAKDDQGRPDVGRNLLAQAYADERCDLAVGPTSSAVALAMLPVAAEHRRVLVVEPAVADSITGAHWNRFIFRTGRSSTQDAVGNAVALDGPGVQIATLAQDYAFGRDGVAAFRAAVRQATIVHEEYLPQQVTDFTGGIQRVVERLRAAAAPAARGAAATSGSSAQPGTGTTPTAAAAPPRRIIFVIWAGSNTPFAALANQDLRRRFGIEVAAGGNILPAMADFKAFPGMEGATYYYHGIPKNPVNDWLVREHERRFGGPPDFLTAGGMAAAMAVVRALQRTGGDPGTERLIAAMEGMDFDTPKGRMSFRREDHQALQDMFHFRIRVDPAVAWGIPELVRVLPAAEIPLPVRNGRA